MIHHWTPPLKLSVKWETFVCARTSQEAPVLGDPGST